MYCKNCGKVLNQEEKFCANCGAKVENETSFVVENNIIENNVNQNPEVKQNFESQPQTNGINLVDDGNQNSQQINNVYHQMNSFEQQDVNKQYVDVNNTKKSNWKKTTSLVIGIISLVLVFIFQIFTIPLSIVGLVFGIISVKENKKNKVGLILNIISLGLAIPILLLYLNLLGMGSNPTIGTWDCKAFNNGYEDLEYIITMKLEKNNKFKWNKYNDEKNNYVIGEYEFIDLHKTNNNGTASYYSIILTGDEFVDNGILQTEPYKSEYEMGIIKNSDEAILMNVQTHNMYYCHRNSK
ncbi:MAG: zinc-ribbon domain-containing protein [Mollicutes bacterium]|nr:zinc-ribbon domain-containing protein [Mollicutes bacterium]